jgi:predicted 2-oxoglutarate/Fe(II)-dependent dioxygenase YbiX
MFPRTVSLSFYVNDDFDGGEIEFQHFNISHKPTAGDIILFSSSYPYMHRVKPVTDGTRYAIVNWYRYKGFPLKKDV